MYELQPHASINVNIHHDELQSTQNFRGDTKLNKIESMVISMYLSWNLKVMLFEKVAMRILDLSTYYN